MRKNHGDVRPRFVLHVALDVEGDGAGDHLRDQLRVGVGGQADALPEHLGTVDIVKRCDRVELGVL